MSVVNIEDEDVCDLTRDFEDPPEAGSSSGGAASRRNGGGNSDFEQQIAEVRASLGAKRREREAAEETYTALCEEEQALESTLKALQADAKQQLESRDWSATFGWSEKEEVINATLDKKDTLVIMPTGGGKSLLYMLPALIEDGFTLVISPLLSLMHDQLEQLTAMGIQAALVSAHTDKDKVVTTYNALVNPRSGLRLLYVTPERIVKSKTLLSKLEKAHKAGLLQRVAIDEAHCISHWGHDWRQDYAKLGLFKEQFVGVPVMALTATATAQVQSDIRRSLSLSSPLTFRRSVDRPNLHYQVREKPVSADAAMHALCSEIQTNFRNQPGIVYCFSKKEAEQVAKYLHDHGIRAKFYHADLEMYGDASGRSGRMEVYQEWSDGRVQVVVATIAFGMGINKANVRFVLHHSLSKSPAAYYQEAGRAGRDGEPATCLLYYRPADLVRQCTLAVGNQLHGAVQGVYQLVSYCEAMLALPPGPEMHLLGRELIARHFNEKIRLRERGKPRKEGGKEEDVTAEAVTVIQILKQLGKVDKPTTLLQLAEIWKGTGRKAEWNLPAVTAPSTLSRADCERRLALMLVDGSLQQKFSFTAYAVNSYLQPGPKAAATLDGTHRVMIRGGGAGGGGSEGKKKAGKRRRKGGKEGREESEEEEEEEEEEDDDDFQAKSKGRKSRK